MDAVAIDASSVPFLVGGYVYSWEDSRGFWTLQLNSRSTYDGNLKDDHSCIKYCCYTRHTGRCDEIG